MSPPFRVFRVLGDRPFAEVGEPSSIDVDEPRGLVAVAAGTPTRHPTPVGVYRLDDLSCVMLVRARYPVHALAFHPTLPLLAVGGGTYDGGYFFEGELFVLDVETGRSTSLLADDYLGRQILSLRWLDDERLQLLVSPSDDSQDDAAHHEGQVAVLRHTDWRPVSAASVTDEDLVGPRVAATPTDHNVVQAALTAISPKWSDKRNVRAVELLRDDRVIAGLGGVLLESWLPSNKQQWTVSDEHGGKDIAVVGDRFAWCGVARPPWVPGRQAIVRVDLTDGTRADNVSLPHSMSLLRFRDGQPALAPATGIDNRYILRIRRARRAYFREQVGRHQPPSAPPETWFSTMDHGASGPRPTTAGPVRRLFPFSWEPGEHHYAGPGAELDDGTFVHTGHVYADHTLRPGGSFVVRRDGTDGSARWVFWTDTRATALDVDDDTAYIGYHDGEIVILNLDDGSVRWRGPLSIGAATVIPTALTIPEPGRVLIGTDDGRIIDGSPMPCGASKRGTRRQR